MFENKDSFYRFCWFTFFVVVAILIGEHFGMLPTETGWHVRLGDKLILRPTCWPMSGETYAVVTHIDADMYYLTEFSDPFSMDTDWHYEMPLSKVTEGLLPGDVVRVKVWRDLPGHFQKILDIVSTGHTMTDIPLPYSIQFNEQKCKFEKR